MKQYKFRAYHKESNKIYPVTCYFEDGYGTGFAHTVCILLEEGKERYDDKTLEGVIGEDLILMQYTGLKDKNGKEIYEGDIVSTDEDGIKEVQFLDGKFCIQTDYGEGRYNAPLCDFMYSETKNNELEVIGNKYETVNNNPDLLKQED